MNPNILHVGLDVDDTQYHGSAFNKDSGEVIDFRCRPTLKGHLVLGRRAPTQGLPIEGPCRVAQLPQFRMDRRSRGQVARGQGGARSGWSAERSR